jgi:aminoglycoside 6-adenylyltransferase
MMRDNELKRNLLGFVETHARAVYGPERDTWHMGRYLDEWADPCAVKALKNIFPRYDANDAWRCLRNSMDLFSWLARESAEKLNYPYPEQVEQNAYQIVNDLEKESA